MSSPIEEFGVRTLKILEDYDDWNADMLDEISQSARELGLAEEGPDGMFKLTEKAQEVSS